MHIHDLGCWSLFRHLPNSDKKLAKQVSWEFEENASNAEC
jgi:hypothetical protein